MSDHYARCAARVTEPPHYIHHYRCSRKAALVKGSDKGGIPLCRQHAKQSRLSVYAWPDNPRATVWVELDAES